MSGREGERERIDLIIISVSFQENTFAKQMG